MSGEQSNQSRVNGINVGDQEANVASPPSRFTAVNGRESPASAGTVNGDRSPPNATEASRPSHQRSPPTRSNEDRPGQPRMREWSQNRDNGDVLSRSLPGANHPQPPMLNHGIPRRSPPHKRKRSPSADRQGSGPTAGHVHGVRKNIPADARTGVVRFEGGDTRRGSYSSTEEARDRFIEGGIHGANGDGWSHAPRVAPISSESRESSSVRGGHSDAELAEALRRESYPQADDRGRRQSRPDTDGAADRGASTGAVYDDRRESITADYGSSRTRAEQLQDQANRRKRIFSNRTKTGCLTCRRRKKKCDEGKPDCNNCLRGGFVCEGYNNRVEWQKNTREKAPIPLQAKDGEPPGSMAYAQQGQDEGVQHHMSDAPPPDHGLSGRRNSQNARNGADGHLRTVSLEDDRDRTLAPINPRIHASDAMPKGSWNHAATPPYASDLAPNAELTRVPPIRELSRAVAATASERSPAPSSHRSMVQSSQSPRAQQVQAQLALQHHHALQSRPLMDEEMDERTEKEKMLAGALYMPMDEELKSDRERCKGALWRFNNSMNPNLGISPEERDRLFRNVVQPMVKPGEPVLAGPLGRVGEDVVVEAPFNCDYGYNINIGAEVLIGTNCTIMDTCSVTIGARTVIGPNVNLLTATMPIDPRRRKGSRGPSLGRAIVIEEDCWIGAGVSILPGLKIGKSSTVGAGSVVTRDVPRFTVVAGNPARVHRGIYANDNNM